MCRIKAGTRLGYKELRKGNMMWSGERDAPEMRLKRWMGVKP